MAGLDEQEDDADSNEQQRPDDGAAAHSADSSPIEIALGAGHAALRPGLFRAGCGADTSTHWDWADTGAEAADRRT